MARFSILLPLAWLSLLHGTLADTVCSQPTYSSLLGLSTYAPAESYCSQYFPQTKVKTTVTVTVTMTTLAKMLKRDPATNAKKTTTTTPGTTGPCNGACSTLASITVSQPVPFQSTFCSCIESPPTKTVTKTVTPKPTTTSKSKKTTKTTTPGVTTPVTTTPLTTSSAPAPTNEVLNPGFENGGLYWSFAGCAVDCNYPNSGSCETLFTPTDNTLASVAQDFSTTAGSSYALLALGYVGTSSITVVPIFTLQINGFTAYQGYVCGDGSGGTAGCFLDGQAHYMEVEVPYTATGTDTNLLLAVTYSDPNASTNSLTILVDDVDFQLAS